MQTYISSSSPLLTYSPCRRCDTSHGFDSGSSFFSTNATGMDSGMVTTSTGSTTVAFNFTGTGATFDLSFSDASAWTTSITVNSTTPPASATSTNSAITSLPYGMHLFELVLSPISSSPSSESSNSTSPWALVNGVLGDLGIVQGANATNTSIDDTAWRSDLVLLSPGWNMLESASSNWINTAEFDAELTTADRDFNSSVSWTDEKGESTTIKFTGEAVWVFGIVGGGKPATTEKGQGGDDFNDQAAGTFSVTLDNTSYGVFDAQASDRVWQQVLFHTSGLAAGIQHEITLENLDGRLSFDRLVAMDTAVPGTMTPGAVTSNTTSSSSTGMNGTDTSGTGVITDTAATVATAAATNSVTVNTDSVTTATTDTAATDSVTSSVTSDTADAANTVPTTSSTSSPANPTPTATMVGTLLSMPISAPSSSSSSTSSTSSETPVAQGTIAAAIIGNNRARVVSTPIIIIVSSIGGTIVVALIALGVYAWWRKRKYGSLTELWQSKWSVDKRSDSPNGPWAGSNEKIRPFVPLVNDDSGPVMTNFATSRPLHEVPAGAHFSLPASSFGNSTYLLPSRSPPSPLLPPVEGLRDSPNSGSGSPSSLAGLNLPPNKKTKLAVTNGPVGGRSISNPKPIDTSLARGPGSIGGVTGGFSRYLEMTRGDAGPDVTYGSYGSTGKIGVGKNRNSAMDAAVTGSHSPLTALQRGVSPTMGGTGAGLFGASLGVPTRGDTRESGQSGRTEGFEFLSAYGVRNSDGAGAFPRDAGDRSTIGLAVSEPSDMEFHLGRDSTNGVTGIGRLITSHRLHDTSGAGAGAGTGPGAGGAGGGKNKYLGSELTIGLGGESIIPALEPERSPRRRLFGAGGGGGGAGGDNGTHGYGSSTVRWR